MESSHQQTTNPLKLVILGLSITSSWGNGHATTYRGLVRELSGRGHNVLFLERDQEWYAANRDLPSPPYGRTELYSSVRELKERFTDEIGEADFVMLGSYVQDGIEIGEWLTRIAGGVKAFYDIDTPVTLAGLGRERVDYITRRLIPRYDLYLSFTGGPILRRLEKQYGAQMARPFYCSADPDLYYPETRRRSWDLGYMGTYSPDRQPTLNRLLMGPARRWPTGRFVVAGPQYPKRIRWSCNVRRLEHLPPAKHRTFYNSQRFTLNVTRADMIEAGYSPSVRLFEAAACGTPIISDPWTGLESFFEVDSEILVARTGSDVLGFLCDMTEAQRRTVGERARQRVLKEHTAWHRAIQLEQYIHQLLRLPTTNTAAGSSRQTEERVAC